MKSMAKMYSTTTQLEFYLRPPFILKNQPNKFVYSNHICTSLVCLTQGTCLINMKLIGAEISRFTKGIIPLDMCVPFHHRPL